MLRSTVSKVMWVGRATVYLVGLAVILALVFGITSAAFGANGQNFILGSLNNTATALTRLTGNVNGAAMQVVNNNADTNDSALSLSVQQGEAPMRVNSSAKVANLNADKLDDREAGSFADGVGGKATDADELDGRDSSEFAAASNVKVGRLDLDEPPSEPFPSAPSNSGTVLETGAFEIRGVCTNHPISPAPEVSLLLVAKQGASAITYTPEGYTTPGERFDLAVGQSVEFAHILVTGDYTLSDTYNTYGSYIADARSGFLEGHGTVAIEGTKCRFSATGLGQ